MIDRCGSEYVAPVDVRVTVAVSNSKLLFGNCYSVVPEDWRDGKYDGKKSPPWRSELFVVDCVDRIVVV